MFLDHPALTAPISMTEPDRLERAYGDAMALADSSGNAAFAHKLTRIHDHKGTPAALWNAAPAKAEKMIFARAWSSQVGDGSDNVEHEF
jgi:hypothetical protein